jgi:hypothetical protein
MPYFFTDNALIMLAPKKTRTGREANGHTCLWRDQNVTFINSVKYSAPVAGV